MERDWQAQACSTLKRNRHLGCGLLGPLPQACKSKICWRSAGGGEVCCGSEKVRQEAEKEEQGRSTESRGRCRVDVMAVNCSQICHNYQINVQLWLRCMKPALLAYLSTAPERDCHWILPCGLLSLFAHVTVNRDNDTSRLTSTFLLWGHKHPPTSWNVPMCNFGVCIIYE